MLIVNKVQGYCFKKSRSSAFAVTSLKICINTHNKMTNFDDSSDEKSSQYKTILSTSNEKIKLLKALNTKKKRDNENLLLLEGHRQIIDAINSGFSPHTLLLSKDAINAPLGNLLLEALKKCDPATIYRSSDSIIQSISDTVHSQGIVAAFPKPITLTHLPALDSPLIVLLDRPADPGVCVHVDTNVCTYVI